MLTKELGRSGKQRTGPLLLFDVGSIEPPPASFFKSIKNQPIFVLNDKKGVLI
jgi:hypothetical protein